MQHIQPGSEAPEECDYWFDQEHDRSFMTFVDAYPGHGATAPLAHKPKDGPRVRIAMLLLSKLLLSLCYERKGRSAVLQTAYD